MCVVKDGPRDGPLASRRALHMAIARGRITEVRPCSSIPRKNLHSAYMPDSSRAEKQNGPGAEAPRPLIYLGWLMGLEPTTTGITILDSTN